MQTSAHVRPDRQVRSLTEPEFDFKTENARTLGSVSNLSDGQGELSRVGAEARAFALPHPHTHMPHTTEAHALVCAWLSLWSRGFHPVIRSHVDYVAINILTACTYCNGTEAATSKKLENSAGRLTSVLKTENDGNFLSKNTFPLVWLCTLRTSPLNVP